MKNKKNKRLITLLLPLLLLSGVSAVTGVYAYWNTSKQSDTITIDVGQRITLAVTPSDLSDGQLIPSDVTPLADQVTKVTTSFTLNVSGNVDLSRLQLKVTDEGRTFTGRAEYVNYFVVKVGDKVINSLNPYIENAAASMTISVEFSIVVPVDDRTEATAEALTAGTFVITLGFEVLNK